MSKLRVLAQKCAATVATAAALGSNTAASLFPKGSNTAASLHDTLHWLVSHLKTPFYSRVCRIGSNTSPNFAQESHFPDSWELGDEFDHEDYDEWYTDEMEEWDQDDWDYYHHGDSWQVEAVDEAIDDEQPGEYPPGDRSSGDWLPF